MPGIVRRLAWSTREAMPFPLAGNDAGVRCPDGFRAAWVGRTQRLAGTRTQDTREAFLGAVFKLHDHFCALGYSILVAGLLD